MVKYHHQHKDIYIYIEESRKKRLGFLSVSSSYSVLACLHLIIAIQTMNIDVSAGKGWNLKLEPHIDGSWLMIAINSKVNTN